MSKVGGGGLQLYNHGCPLCGSKLRGPIIRVGDYVRIRATGRTGIIEDIVEHDGRQKAWIELFVTEGRSGHTACDLDDLDPFVTPASEAALP